MLTRVIIRIFLLPDANGHAEDSDRRERAEDPGEVEVAAVEIASENESNAKQSGHSHERSSEQREDVSDIGSCLIEIAAETIIVSVISCSIASSESN